MGKERTERERGTEYPALGQSKPFAAPATAASSVCSFYLKCAVGSQGCLYWCSVRVSSAWTFCQKSLDGLLPRRRLSERGLGCMVCRDAVCVSEMTASQSGFILTMQLSYFVLYFVEISDQCGGAVGWAAALLFSHTYAKRAHAWWAHENTRGCILETCRKWSSYAKAYFEHVHSSARKNMIFSGRWKSAEEWIEVCSFCGGKKKIILYPQVVW